MNRLGRFTGALVALAVIATPLAASARTVRPSSNLVKATVVVPVTAPARVATPVKGESEIIFGLPIALGIALTVGAVVGLGFAIDAIADDNNDNASSPG